MTKQLTTKDGNAVVATKAKSPKTSKKKRMSSKPIVRDAPALGVFKVSIALICKEHRKERDSVFAFPCSAALFS